jgi:short-subunit dehydrogenase
MAGEAYALVTGASSGFGVDFARDLAGRGYDLIVVARREDKLREVAAEIERDFGRKVEVVVADLAVEAERDRLNGMTLALEKPVDVLINNAGLGLYGNFATIPWEKERQMLEIDIVAVAHLTKLFTKAMVERGKGYVLNVASIGAFQPTPLYASYSAAKAFVLSYSQAVNYELRGTGVSVTVVSPGISATEFLTVSKQEPTAYQKLAMMQSKDVVAIALKALFARRAAVVPGPANALMAFGSKLSPDSLSTRLAYLLMRSNDAVH